MADRTSTLTLRVRDDYSSGLGRFRDQLSQTNNVARQTEGTFAKLTAGFKSGIGLVGGFAAGAAAAYGLKQAFGATIQGAVQFDQAMRQVNSVALLNERQFGALSTSVKDFTRSNDNFTGSAKDAANSLNIVVQAGVDVSQGMDVLKAASKGATAGFTDIRNVTEALTGIMNAYGESATRADHNTNVLAQTVATGVITWQQLTQNIGEVAQSAAAAKVPIEVVGAAIATMTQKGITADLAVTSLNRILLSVIAPSKEAADLARELGIEWNFQALQVKGLVPLLTELMRATNGNVEQVNTLTGDVRAFRGVLALTNDGMVAYNRNLGDMAHAQDGVGAAQKQADQALKATATQWALFRKEVGLLAAELGETLLPAINNVLSVLTKVAKTWRIDVSITGLLREGGTLLGLPVFPLPWQGKAKGAQEAKETAAEGLVLGADGVWRNPKYGPTAVAQTQWQEAWAAEEAFRALAAPSAPAAAKMRPAATPDFGLAADILSAPHQANIDAYQKQLDAIRESSQGAGDSTKAFKDAVRESERALKAAQDALKGSGDEVKKYEASVKALRDQLANLKNKLDELSKPRLTGAGAFEEQQFALQQKIRIAQLAQLEGEGGTLARIAELEKALAGARAQLTPGQKAQDTLQLRQWIDKMEDALRFAKLDKGEQGKATEELQKQLEILQLQREIFTAPVEFQALRMAKPPGAEMAPETVFAQIIDTQKQIAETTTQINGMELQLAASQASFEMQQGVVDELTEQLDIARQAQQDASDAVQGMGRATRDAEQSLRAMIQAEEDYIAGLKQATDAAELSAAMDDWVKGAEGAKDIIGEAYEGIRRLGERSKMTLDEMSAALAGWLTGIKPDWGIPQAGLYASPEFGGNFAAGGTVPGPEGMPRLIMAHGGEEVQTRAQQSGGLTVNFNSTFPPSKADADAIVSAIEDRLQDRNRSIPGGILQ